MSGVVLLRAVPDPEATDPGASLLLDAASLVALGQALAWRKGVSGARLIGRGAGPPRGHRTRRGRGEKGLVR